MVTDIDFEILENQITIRINEKDYVEHDSTFVVVDSKINRIIAFGNYKEPDEFKEFYTNTYANLSDEDVKDFSKKSKKSKREVEEKRQLARDDIKNRTYTYFDMEHNDLRFMYPLNSSTFNLEYALEVLMYFSRFTVSHNKFKFYHRFNYSFYYPAYDDFDNDIKKKFFSNLKKRLYKAKTLSINKTIVLK